MEARTYEGFVGDRHHPWVAGDPPMSLIGIGCGGVAGGHEGTDTGMHGTAIGLLIPDLKGSWKI